MMGSTLAITGTEQAALVVGGVVLFCCCDSGFIVMAVGCVRDVCVASFSFGDMSEVALPIFRLRRHDTTRKRCVV